MEYIGSYSNWKEALVEVQKMFASGSVRAAATVSANEYRARRWFGVLEAEFMLAVNLGIIPALYPAKTIHVFRNRTDVDEGETWWAILVYLKEGEDIEIN